MSQQEGKFRTAIFGGYNRSDVLNFITESVQAQQAEMNMLHNNLGYLESQLREAEGLREQMAELEDQRRAMQEALARLEQENEVLRDRCQAAEQAQSDLNSRCEAAEQEKSALEAEYAATVVDARSYAALRDQVGNIELEARTRGQAMLNEAEAAVARIYEQANHSLDKVRWNYNGACTNVENILSHLVEELRRSELMLSELTRAMDEGRGDLAALRLGTEEK